MSKLNVRICSCGRIHFIPESEIDEALEANKNFVLVCGGCGRVTAIGADIEQDWEDPAITNYNMYAYPMGQHNNFILTAENFETVEGRKGIQKVWYSVGEQVMMQTGYYAKHYDAPNGRFEDIWYPDFWKVQRSNITVEEIQQFIKEWEHDRVTVNMNWLLRTLSDDEAEALSHFYIKGLDWTGTKYERKR